VKFLGEQCGKVVAVDSATAVAPAVATAVAMLAGYLSVRHKNVFGCVARMQGLFLRFRWGWVG